MVLYSGISVVHIMGRALNRKQNKTQGTYILVGGKQSNQSKHITVHQVVIITMKSK